VAVVVVVVVLLSLPVQAAVKTITRTSSAANSILFVFVINNLLYMVIGAFLWLRLYQILTKKTMNGNLKHYP
jgi:hypothetical protein